MSDSNAKPTCFVAMPISDVEPYAPGHFRRVFDHLITPACEKAGFTPILASDVKETNMIVLDVLDRLYKAEMVLCDVSARNPNVFFELGFRQAFNRPVTLIKDDVTERVFDIAGLRDVTYEHSLRVDAVQEAISRIAERMAATYDSVLSGSGGVNSLVQLLSVTPASVPAREELSDETKILLNAINNLGDRLNTLERASTLRRQRQESTVDKSAPPLWYVFTLNGEKASVEAAVQDLHEQLEPLAIGLQQPRERTFVLEFGADGSKRRRDLNEQILRILTSHGLMVVPPWLAPKEHES